MKLAIGKNFFSVCMGLAVLSLLGCGKHEQPKTDAENTAAFTPSKSASEAKYEDDPLNDIRFNFETKTVTLNSGYEMPIYGIGTYSLLDEVCVDAVSTALEKGVRLIDTAYMYHKE